MGVAKTQSFEVKHMYTNMYSPEDTNKHKGFKNTGYYFEGKHMYTKKRAFLLQETPPPPILSMIIRITTL